jgi:hypothetical protein
MNFDRPADAYLQAGIFRPDQTKMDGSLTERNVEPVSLHFNSFEEDVLWPNQIEPFAAL